MPRFLHPALLAFALCAGSLPAQEALQPRGFVNDYAGVMSPQAKAQLEALATEVQQKTGAEVAVAIVRSLEGDTVEDHALRLAERWGVGDRNDRGALLLIAVEDRQLRLEVGYGLEPILPDGRAGQILDVMRPLLRQGDYDAAVSLGVAETAQIIAADSGVELSGVPENVKRRRWPNISPWIWLTVILVLALVPRRRRRGGWHDDAVRTAWWLGNIGGRGGGGGGWSSGGGGGFGGFGGGGFGGGGASRGW